MADVTTIKWLYPPNFNGFYANPKVGHKRHIIRLTNVSDGTGETDAIKVNRSELKTNDGNVPSKLVVEKVEYACTGMDVILEWDNAADEKICVLGQGQEGCLDFKPQGGLVPSNDDGTGDIVLTTVNHSSGDSYDITLTVRLKD